MGFSLSERREERFSLWSSAAKYFLHGLAFSLILFLALEVWLIGGFVIIVELPFLRLVGFVVVLIVGFALVLLVLGGLNATLTERIWHVAIDQGWGHVVLQSLLLLLVFFLVAIPGVLANLLTPSWLIPSWVIGVVNFVVYGFVDGLVAKKVAFVWKSDEMLDEGFRGFLTVLKYPGLFGLFAADAVVVAPLFIMSLGTKFWWVGTLVFFSIQSPIIVLILKEVRNERNKWALPSGGWYTPGEPAELGSKVSGQTGAPPGEPAKLGVQVPDQAVTILGEPAVLGVKVPEQALVAGGFSGVPVVGRFFSQGLAHALLAALFGFLCLGLGFYLVVLGFFTLGWTGVGAFLVTFWLVVGLALGFVADCFVVGFINTRLTEVIWQVEIRHDWKSLLAHGLALNGAFALASIPLLVVALYPVILPISLTLFLVYCFVYGVIGRRVAFNWEIRGLNLDDTKVSYHERYQNRINV